MKNILINTTLGLFALLAFSSGLAMAQNAISPADAKMSTVMAAESKGDFDYLGQVCQREVNANHVTDKACTVWVNHLKKTKDVAALEKICTNKRKKSMPTHAFNASCREYKRLSGGNWDAKLANCASLPADYEKQMKKHKDTNTFPIHVAAAKSAFKCKNWNYLYGDLLNNRGGGSNLQAWGVRILRKLDKEKIDIFAGLDAYIQANKAPFGSKYGCQAVIHLTKWMIADKKYDKPERFLKYMKKLTRCGKAQFGIYFHESKCKKADKFVYGLLKSADPKTKSQACRYLGDLGGKKHLKRMRGIAKSDPTFVIKRKVKVYWVRDICKTAIEKIKTRK